MQKNYSSKWEGLSPKKIILWSVLGIFVLVTLICTFYTIDSTERGVLSTFGKVHTTGMEPGLHIKVPFVQTIEKVNVQQKKFDGVENSYTRDVQTAKVNYTINYDIVRENVPNLIKNVGEDYHNRIVVPFIRSAMKDVFGNYAATQIVENRDDVRRDIENMLQETISKEYFTNIQFQITDIDFDDAFENAIKEKQVAEQQALKAKNVTIQVEEQAKQSIIKAEAEAKAIQIKANALAQNPKIVEYEAVQHWNGELPTYMMGNSVPFINIGK